MNILSDFDTAPRAEMVEWTRQAQFAHLPVTHYIGAWIDRKGRITVTRGAHHLPLCPWHDPALLTDHCYQWGRIGAGPAQTALSILCDFLRPTPGGDRIALAQFESFHRQVIATLPDAWVLTEAEITAFLSRGLRAGPSRHRAPGRQ